jgi:hypothetical protein
VWVESLGILYLTVLYPICQVMTSFAIMPSMLPEIKYSSLPEKKFQVAQAVKAIVDPFVTGNNDGACMPNNVTVIEVARHLKQHPNTLLKTIESQQVFPDPERSPIHGIEYEDVHGDTWRIDIRAQNTYQHHRTYRRCSTRPRIKKAQRMGGRRTESDGVSAAQRTFQDMRSKFYSQTQRVVLQKI